MTNLEYEYVPIADTVIVEVTRSETKSQGGIILDVTVREQMAKSEGKVLSLGKDAFCDSEDNVKVGDIVLFPRYAGKEIEGFHNGKPEIRAVNDIDIIAIKVPKQ